MEGLNEVSENARGIARCCRGVELGLLDLELVHLELADPDRLRLDLLDLELVHVELVHLERPGGPPELDDVELTTSR